MISLDMIGLKYRTDKASSHHGYLDFYEKRLSHLRNSKFLLIEFGIFNGASIAMWREFFPNATIVGVDYDDRCRSYETKDIHVRIGDASNATFQQKLLDEFGFPTVILDDASHRWDHQISSIKFFVPRIAAGGMVIIEDLDTSFERHVMEAPFQGTSNISAFDYISKLSRFVVGDSAMGSEQPYDDWIQLNYQKIFSVEFFRRTCIISGRGPL